MIEKIDEVVGQLESKPKRMMKVLIGLAKTKQHLGNIGSTTWCVLFFLDIPFPLSSFPWKRESMSEIGL
ncbi:MAG: hypothetical protein CL947_02505 [Epsilonproteobacteria bacterium]|nr:hypothetical protein [Campylobacterota bacterium]